MSNIAIINGVEYPTLSEGCRKLKLNHGYARIKAMKSDEFEMKQVVKIQIIRKPKSGTQSQTALKMVENTEKTPE